MGPVVVVLFQARTKSYISHWWNAAICRNCDKIGYFIPVAESQAQDACSGMPLYTLYMHGQPTGAAHPEPRTHIKPKTRFLTQDLGDFTSHREDGTRHVVWRTPTYTFVMAGKTGTPVPLHDRRIPMINRSFHGGWGCRPVNTCRRLHIFTGGVDKALFVVLRVIDKVMDMSGLVRTCRIIDMSGHVGYVALPLKRQRESSSQVSRTSFHLPLLWFCRSYLALSA
ncbi:hypothetical protein J6590_015588 [Homalodisca vitripennis]|nr:hypothetical protein J6590_015588 [Homalodisca vitripennis]